MYKVGRGVNEGIYQFGAGRNYNVMGFPVGYFSNTGLTDMAETVSRPILAINQYMGSGHNEEMKAVKKKIPLGRPKPRYPKDMEKMPYVVGDLEGEGKRKTKLRDRLRKLKEKRLKGKGFLSDMFGTIGSVLGTIGKPIFDNVPMLKPFSGLLGDNSGYALASKGLKSIGLGKRKGGRKIMMPDHPKYNEVVKGCGAPNFSKNNFDDIDMTKPSMEFRRKRREKKDITY